MTPRSPGAEPPAAGPSSVRPVRSQRLLRTLAAGGVLLAVCPGPIWGAPNQSGGDPGGQREASLQADPDAAALAADIRELRSWTSDPDLAIEAALELTAILDALDARRDAAGRLPEIEAELFLRALEYRARAHLARGAPERAADDLRLVVLGDPTWRLDVTELSAAVVDLFEQQRGELLAYLSVFTEPAGVTVRVEDEVVGSTPLQGRAIFAGRVTIRLERPGFAVHSERQREILAGERIEIEHVMERSRPVLSVITAPAGVTVRVGGRVAGVTDGSLPEDLRPLVPPRFAREEFSAPLRLGNLETGANEITLEAPCRTPSRFTFHADEARDYLPRFVRLRPSTGGLRIESEPSGGAVVLDGEERGVTPLSFSAMCSGDHDVEIRHPAGRCARAFHVSRGARTAVSCEVLPVIALEGEPSAGESEAVAETRRALRAREDYFFLEAPDEHGIQARVRVVLPEPGGGSARVEFRAAGSRAPDVVGFDRFEPDALRAALDRLLTPPLRRRPWLGLTALAIAGATANGRENGADAAPDRAPGLEITSVHPAGPAVLAGIERGDEIREVEGRRVQDELALAELVAAGQPDGTLDLVVRRGETERALRLVLSETPILPSLAADQCNLRLVQLEADFARGGSDPTHQLEAGICWILAGDPERALLRRLNGLEAPAGAGIGAGAVHYYRGLAFEALGERARAAEAFAAAAAVPGATLVTHDGPPLAPLALRRLAATR